MGSFQHLTECIGVGELPTTLGEDEEQEAMLKDYPKDLAYDAYSVNPGFPVPHASHADAEIELETIGEIASCSEANSTHTLELDQDVEQ